MKISVDSIKSWFTSNSETLGCAGIGILATLFILFLIAVPCILVPAAIGHLFWNILLIQCGGVSINPLGFWQCVGLVWLISFLCGGVKFEVNNGVKKDD